MFGVGSFFSHLDWGTVLFLGQIFILVAAVFYFATLHNAAQDAAFFALPRRRFLEKTKLGRRALAFFAPKNAAREHLTGQIDLNEFEIREVDDNPLARGNLFFRLLKRGMDILAAATLLVFTAPLLVTTALAIRLDTDGPIFYRQIRVGRGGRQFQILKFRTMYTDAERDGAAWARENDCRVTPLGHFLRRSRLDEIPQTINILLGDMSFVGPRPERPEFTAELSEKIAHYDDRHLVKPGLTGWAQINYPYGASVEDAREKLTYDLYYIKNFSLILDLFIIIKTIKVAVLGIGSR